METQISSTATTPVIFPHPLTEADPIFVLEAFVDIPTQIPTLTIAIIPAIFIPTLPMPTLEAFADALCRLQISPTAITLDALPHLATILGESLLGASVAAVQVT